MLNDSNFPFIHADLRVESSFSIKNATVVQYFKIWSINILHLKHTFAIDISQYVLTYTSHGKI